MRKLLALLLCLGLGGCATTAGYEAVLSSWVGSSESSLISSWGTPQNSYVMADGNRVIEYRKGTSMQMGGYSYTTPQTTYHSGSVQTYGDLNTYGSYSGTSTQYVTQTTPTYNVPIWCNTSFIVNTVGIIQSWNWQGNSCVAVTPPKISKTERVGDKEMKEREYSVKQLCGGKMGKEWLSCYEEWKSGRSRNNSGKRSGL